MFTNNKFNWRFPILDGGKRQGINDSGIATFAGSDLYNNLAREICQNSLDAKDPDSKDPVIVTFNLMDLLSTTFQPAIGLKKIFSSCKKYWESNDDLKLNLFLKQAFDTLEEEPLEVLKISDYNTMGLDGSKNRTGAWDALTGSNGVSYKNSGSQGSYGIGKNAPYACSNLRTVFYNTYSKKDNVKAFQGVTSLVTHINEAGEETQGCGFYYNSIDRKPIFDEDNFKDIQIFNRNQYGTDIIILGFKKNEDWEKDIKLAIVKNFFIAILDKKLVVYIDNIKIDHQTLVNIVDKELKANYDDLELKKVKNYLETYLAPDKKFELNLLEKNDVSLFVKISDEYTRNIAYFRSTGMLICEKNIKKMKPYQAILIVSGDKLNDELKLMEPPKHDKWDPKLLVDENIANGKKIMKALNNFIQKSIESICKIETPSEIDPDGVSSFLPDDIDFINNSGKSNTKTESSETVEIENVKKEKIKISNYTNIGKPDIGIENTGDVHNSTDSGNKNEDVTTSGDRNPDGANIVSEDKNGSKTISTPLYSILRIIPIDYKKGLYKLISSFIKDYDKVQFIFKTVGEDGAQDQLSLIGYNHNSKFIIANQDSYEISNIEKNKIYTNIIRLNINFRTVIIVEGVGYENK